MHGYALVRNALPVETVLRARRVVLEAFSAGWGRVDEIDLIRGAMKQGSQPGMLLSGFGPIVSHVDMRNLVEGGALFALMEGIYGEAASTFAQKVPFALKCRKT